MFSSMALVVRVLAQVFIWTVIIKILLSYFLAPYHPIREALDRIVDPFLNPIRRVVPLVGMLDFSPMILVIAVDILSRILISLLLSI
jgi:YggT family protein